MVVNVTGLGDNHDDHATPGGDSVSLPDAQVPTGVQEVSRSYAEGAGWNNNLRTEGVEELRTGPAEAGRIYPESDMGLKKTCRFDYRIGGWKRRV